MKYFKIEELVNPIIFKMLSPELCENLIKDYIKNSLDLIREDLGEPITINTGDLQNCGIRLLNHPTGAKKSKHKLGIAYDLHTKNLSKLIDLIKKDYKKYHVSRIENPDITKTWLHIEFMESIPRKLIIFDP